MYYLYYISDLNCVILISFPYIFYVLYNLWLFYIMFIQNVFTATFMKWNLEHIKSITHLYKNVLTFQNVVERESSRITLTSLYSLEATVSDVQKKIRAAFEAFDYESNNTVDVRWALAVQREVGIPLFSWADTPDFCNVKTHFSEPLRS